MKLLIVLTTAMAVASVQGEIRHDGYSSGDGPAVLNSQIEVIREKLAYVYGKHHLRTIEKNTAHLYGEKKLEALGKTYNALKAATEGKIRSLLADPQELLRKLATDPKAAVTLVHQLKTIAIDMYYDLLKLLDQHSVTQIPQYFYERLMENLTELFKKTRNLRNMVNEQQLGDMAESAGLGGVITKEKLHETLETVDAFSLENIKPVIDTIVPNVAHHLAPLFNKELMKAVLDGFDKLCDSLIEKRLITRFFHEVMNNEDLQSLRQTLQSADIGNPTMDTIVSEFFSIKDGVYKSAESVSEMPIVEELRTVFENSMSNALNIMATVTENVFDDILSSPSIQFLSGMFPSINDFLSQENQPEEEDVEAAPANDWNNYDGSVNGMHHMHSSHQPHYYSNYGSYY